MGPSIFAATGSRYCFLHSQRNLVGNWINATFWNCMTWAVRGSAHYDSSSNGRQIKPQTSSIFWDTPYVSLTYTTNPWLSWPEDESKIRVYREIPIRLHDKTMQLQSPDGETHDIPL